MNFPHNQAIACLRSRIVSGRRRWVLRCVVAVLLSCLSHSPLWDSEAVFAEAPEHDSQITFAEEGLVDPTWGSEEDALPPHVDVYTVASARSDDTAMEFESEEMLTDEAFGGDGLLENDLLEDGIAPEYYVREFEPYTWQVLPRGLIYRSYLAGAKESRFRSVWNHESTIGNVWDISLGGRAGIIRYGTTDPDYPSGWQIDIEGAAFPRLDLDINRELVSADFRFGVPITWGNRDRQYKFAYYHLSSHLGDEFMLRNPTFPRVNYSRDVLVFGISQHIHDDWRVYFEAGWAFYTDVSEPWELQFGIEYSPRNCTGFHGAPFLAANGHLREEVDFSGNLVLQAGWLWRGTPNGGIFRVGFEYYHGKSEQFEFFRETEEKVGVGLWYDF